MSAGEQFWAYCGKRAATRNSTKDEPRHAVSDMDRLTGALGAE